MPTIYHNPRCSTSRNALQILQDRGYNPKIVEYLKTPPTRDELAALIKRSNLSVREAIRTKEAIYTDLNLGDPELSDEQLLDAMLEHPILINRPFVVTEKGTRLARPLAALDEIL